MSKALNLADLYDTPRQKRTNDKPLRIRAEPQVTSEIPFKTIGVMLSVIALVVVIINVAFGVKEQSKNFNKGSVISRSKQNMLRRMVRMKCQTLDSSTHCTTIEKGDYVVTTKGCEDVFDFNGIPFTDVPVDDLGNYRVPTATDMTLRIKDKCPNIAVMVDTLLQPFDSYASSQSTGNGIIERLVWITDVCHTEFTVKINDINIYESTPSSMIKTSKLSTKVAYIYIPDVDYLSGAVSIVGKGCNAPIQVYTKRSER